MVMPAGASPGSAFLTIPVNEPLRRLPQMVITLRSAMVARCDVGVVSGRLLLGNAGFVATLGPAFDLAGHMRPQLLGGGAFRQRARRANLLADRVAGESRPHGVGHLGDDRG